VIVNLLKCVAYYDVTLGSTNVQILSSSADQLRSSLFFFVNLSCNSVCSSNIDPHKIVEKLILIQFDRIL